MTTHPTTSSTPVTGPRERAVAGHFNTASRNTRASRFLPGDMIADRFIVMRFIASGGMGEVYEVEDTFLDNVHVALKMMLPEFAADKSTQHRFQQEVILARKVAHPAICPIYDIFHCNQPAPPFSFLTMRLLPGETLAARLQRTTSLPTEEAMSVFRQMTIALAALHAGGIIHRDIKTNNVMLDGTGQNIQLWITDFGLARLDEPELTAYSRNVIAGTRGYMAPELLAGEPPSQASDIYAFGVVLHLIFFGEKPQVDPNTLSAVVSSRLKNSGIPADVTPLLPSFLADDPRRRTAAFQQALQLLDPNSGSFIRPTQPFWNRRRFITATAVTSAAAIGGVRWKWDELTDMLHPLPQKRFVALLNWPASDPRIKPMLAGVIEAIGGALARAEAFDRDLLVIPHTIQKDVASAKDLNELRESLGANLVLAASGMPQDKELHLSLRVLDPASARPLREKNINWPIAEPISLPSRAVQAATQLLDVSHYQQSDRSKPDTQSAQAYAAFQAAEDFRKQDNDVGLDKAIEKYKQAIDLDSRYATAHAKLASAYLRYYFVHGDSGALNLARANVDTALSLNPDLVEGHVAHSQVLEESGDKDSAIREMTKALSLDPGNPRTLVSQGQLYTRLNRWDQAEDTFQRALKLRPNNWLGHEELGFLFNAEGKYPQAVAEFKTANLAAPKSTVPLNNLGAMYVQQGRIAEAKVALKRCLDLGINDAAEKSMASALRCEGKVADALPFALKAVDLNPSDAGNLLELGDCYSLVRGHHADAVKAYEQSASAQEEQLRNDPKDGPGLMLLALSRIKAGISSTASALVEKAEQSDSRRSRLATLQSQNPRTPRQARRSARDSRRLPEARCHRIPVSNHASTWEGFATIPVTGTIAQSMPPSTLTTLLTGKCGDRGCETVVHF